MKPLNFLKCKTQFFVQKKQITPHITIFLSLLWFWTEQVTFCKDGILSIFSTVQDPPIITWGGMGEGAVITLDGVGERAVIYYIRWGKEGSHLLQGMGWGRGKGQSFITCDEVGEGKSFITWGWVMEKGSPLLHAMR